MIVPSPNFLIFAAVAAVIFNLASLVGYQRIVLLLVNLAFLGSFTRDPTALAPFVGFLALGYAAYRVTRSGGRTTVFAALLALTLFAFFWLKRYSFVPSALYLHFPYLLVGLSYVFFRVMHLVIDGHQDALGEPVGLLSYANYTLNFTSIVSGPIQRFQDYRRNEEQPASLTLIDAGRAVERIIVGYFKVAIVSMLLSLLQHREIAELSASMPWVQGLWTGTLIMGIYPVYLYFNFSGYVDVVVGVARFFRLVLPENFDRPFTSENFISFWSRWHMTLSGWLKTYVYNPLMIEGMRRTSSASLAPYVAVFSFFVTFFLVGLWHGQTSEFIFFGVLQGGGVSVNKLYQIMMAKRLGRAQYRTLCGNRLYVVVGRGLTFGWFAFTLLWFWSSWSQIGRFVSELGVGASLLVCLVTILIAAVVLEALGWLRDLFLRPTWSVDPGQREAVFASRYLRTVWCTTLVVMTVATTLVLASPAPELVYKAF